jgi:Xaa-Pro dipeptidase
VKSNNPKLDKAIQLMAQRGLDGLVIYSNGTCIILRPSYLHYFSSFKAMGPRNAALISKSGQVTLFVEPAWDAVRAKQKSWIGDVRGTTRFIEDLTDRMSQMGITGSVGLVAAEEMTGDVFSAIGGIARIVPADHIIEEIAREKSDADIRIARKAARLADIGFEALLKHARPGIREYELSAEIEYAMRSAGADDVFLLLSSGTHNHEMHDPRDRRLREGDTIIAEITPACKGQFVQVCRTLVLGEASPLIREKYDLLVRAQENALQKVRAGVPASGISLAINKVISEAGYAKYCHPPYMRARGHGFGPGSIAPGGVIEDDTQTLFEKDQVVVVHPNQYLPETGYLACGEMVLVAERGFERLSSAKAKLYEKEV